MAASLAQETFIKDLIDEVQHLGNVQPVFEDREKEEELDVLCEIHIALATTGRISSTQLFNVVVQSYEKKKKVFPFDNETSFERFLLLRRFMFDRRFDASLNVNLYWNRGFGYRLAMIRLIHLIVENKDIMTLKRLQQLLEDPILFPQYKVIRKQIDTFPPWTDLETFDRKIEAIQYGQPKYGTVDIEKIFLDNKDILQYDGNADKVMVNRNVADQLPSLWFPNCQPKLKDIISRISDKGKSYFDKSRIFAFSGYVDRHLNHYAQFDGKPIPGVDCFELRSYLTARVTIEENYATVLAGKYAGRKVYVLHSEIGKENERIGIDLPNGHHAEMIVYLTLDTAQNFRAHAIVPMRVKYSNFFQCAFGSASPSWISRRMNQELDAKVSDKSDSSNNCQPSGSQVEQSDLEMQQAVEWERRLLKPVDKFFTKFGKRKDQFKLDDVHQTLMTNRESYDDELWNFIEDVVELEKELLLRPWKYRMLNGESGEKIVQRTPLAQSEAIHELLFLLEMAMRSDPRGITADDVLDRIKQSDNCDYLLNVVKEGSMDSLIHQVLSHIIAKIRTGPQGKLAFKYVLSGVYCIEGREMLIRYPRLT